MEALDIILLFAALLTTFFFFVRPIKALLDEQHREEDEFEKWWFAQPDFHPRLETFEDFYSQRQVAKEQWRKSR